MQSLRKGEWSAITQVKVFSPEICHIALGQGFLHSEASSAAHDNGERVSDVPGSESMAGHSMIHSGTWEGHVVPDSEASNEPKRRRRKYGDMAIGLTHSFTILTDGLSSGFGHIASSDGGHAGGKSCPNPCSIARWVL